MFLKPGELKFCTNLMYYTYLIIIIYVTQFHTEYLMLA